MIEAIRKTEQIQVTRNHKRVTTLLSKRAVVANSQPKRGVLDNRAGEIALD